MTKQKSYQDILKKYTTLSHRVAIVVPSTINIDEVIDNTPYIERVASLFSNSFGGATATTNRGYWMSDTKGLVRESSTFVYANCTESALNESIESVIDLAKSIKTELSQDSVAIEIDGKMLFV